MEIDIPGHKDWAELRSAGSSERYGHHVIYMLVHHLSKRKKLTKFTQEHAWAACFEIDEPTWADPFDAIEQPTAKYAPAEAAYCASPNAMTIALSALTDILYGTIIMDKLHEIFWEEDNYRHELREKYGIDVYNLQKDYDMIHKRLLDYVRDCRMWDLIEKANAQTRQSPEWQNVCKQIGRFCRWAGNPDVINEPSEAILTLRRQIRSDNMHSREGELQRRIENLEKEKRLQQRIITNLSFRHCLESLPGDRPLERGRQNTSTGRWQQFWEDSWTKAQQAANSNNSARPSHPFEPLLHYDQRQQKQIKRMGDDLYGTLSSNIHLYSGEFSVEEDQWNTLEAAILKTLKPAWGRGPDGEVQWEQERERYVDV